MIPSEGALSYGAGQAVAQLGMSLLAGSCPIEDELLEPKDMCLYYDFRGGFLLNKLVVAQMWMNIPDGNYLIGGSLVVFRLGMNFWTVVAQPEMSLQDGSCLIGDELSRGQLPNQRLARECLR